MANCSNCQKELPEGANLCPFCGTPVGEGNTTQTTQAYDQPVQQMQQNYPVRNSGNGLAVASMVLGIIALVLFLIPILPIILGALALVFGIVGVVGKNKPKKGMAIAGIVTSIIALIISGLIAFGLFSAVSSNVERSKESKDLTQLDSILSAANVAIANQKATGKGVIDLGTADTGVQDSSNPEGSEKDRIHHSIYLDTMGAGKASSSAASGADVHIYLSYDASGSSPFISVGYAKNPPEPGKRVDGIPTEYDKYSNAFEVTTSLSSSSSSSSSEKKESGSSASEDDDFDLDDLKDLLDDDEDEEDDEDDDDEKSESKGSTSVRELLDSYEEFVDEYVDFMKKYSKDPVEYMDEYTEYFEKYEDFVKKIDDVKEDDVSADDWAYYLEVTARVLKKIASIYE